ncbi:MAG TPA: cold shock domain-containing protein [Acidimicrobiales bacterium]|nr:cold shock domain-containing protein [Acidimicrobiales bacterium]
MRRRTGEVVEFDERRGWGTMRGDDGVELFFHCTAVADGSRTIAEGTPVCYHVVAGHLGRWEARDVRPAHPPPAGAGRGSTATRSSGPPVTSMPPAR